MSDAGNCATRHKKQARLLQQSSAPMERLLNEDMK